MLCSSVTVYLYNRSQILQYVKYTKSINFCDKYFGDKKTTTTKQNIKHKIPCRSRELNAGPLAPKADTLPLQSQLRVSLVFKLFNCFEAMET